MKRIDGMCPTCTVRPKSVNCAYCQPCHNAHASRRYYAKRALKDRQKGWQRSTEQTRKAPTDWRAVLAGEIK